MAVESNNVSRKKSQPILLVQASAWNLLLPNKVCCKLHILANLVHKGNVHTTHSTHTIYCRNSKRTMIVCHSELIHTKVVRNAFRHVIMFRGADLSPSLFLSISTCHTEWSSHGIYQECYMAWGNTGQLC